MKWDRYSSLMEKYVIKTDVIASEDDYFTATHMPFANLEVICGGSGSVPSTLMGEEDVYRELVCNPDNVHRMIIVRGDNGTGKSHLIRWLKTRFENDTANYNSERERVIFIRRLNNTIRGAISQILEEGIIDDQEMVLKLQNFVASADAQDSDTFKTSIYHAFINFVSNDKSEKFYRTFMCKGIQDFMYDPRIRNHLMRDNGAINRCYKAVTSPSDVIFNGEAAFDREDFALPRALMRELRRQGSTESQDFAEQIYDNQDEIDKLVKYLNQFMPKVIQSCAQISSDNTKEVFKRLRQSLKKQGKELTIFIEDFTAFTGIDAELITVLSSEHGGINSDLCRVTAVIGITDAYYGQFKDNFTDRVQYQINVSENSYNSVEFLEQMTARYLNAIYCDRNKVKEWFEMGANIKTLPYSGVAPDYPWDYVTINNNQFTLYPFNRASISNLYNSLKVKTPRRFLSDVIRSQLKEFFDGRQYGNSKFPTAEFIGDIADKTVQMLPVHAANIDKQVGLSDNDRARLKLVLAVWGDKTALMTDVNGKSYIGNVPKAFLSELGLASVKGISGVSADTAADMSPKSESQPAPQVVPQKKRQYDRYKRDIAAWYSGNRELAYSADYRKWIWDFVRDAICWQAEGIPAHIAASRLHEAVYIEGQSQSVQSEKQIVVELPKNIETHDILHALCDYDYHKGWLFKDAAYYQLKLANWLERNKDCIKAGVCVCENANKQWPILQWCLAVEYLKSLILGRVVDKSCNETVVKTIFRNNCQLSVTEHVSKEWRDVVSYIQTNHEKFSVARTLLTEFSKTFMGTVSDYRVTQVQFYRAYDVFEAVESLQDLNWDLDDFLPQDTKSALILRPAELLKDLYSRIDAILISEINMASDIIDKLKLQIGEEINQASIIATLNAVSELFVVFNSNRIQYPVALKARFDIAPLERTKSVMTAYSLVNEAILSLSRIEKLELLSSNPVSSLSGFLGELQEIDRIARKEKKDADAEIKRLAGGIDITGMAADSIKYMSGLVDAIESLEVNADAN